MLNSLLPPVVKAHSTGQGVLSLVPLPKMDELYPMLNGSTIYSSLDCTSEYHHFALTSKAQNKSVSVSPFGKFELKKVYSCYSKGNK